MIAVSFDYDGVLAKSPFAHGVLFPVLDELAHAYSERSGVAPEDAKKKLRELIWGKFRRRIAAEEYVDAYDWQNLVSRAAADLDLPFDRSLPDMTKVFSETLAREHDTSLVYSHAHRTLRKLRDRGVCLIMLTNGFREYQVPTAEALGLAGFFPRFFASDDLGTVKPFREAFETAFRSCPEANGEKFHVGDSLTQDVAGARGAGIFSIWVHRELPEELGRLSPCARAKNAAILPVIEEKLAGENQSAVQLSPQECRPDAVVTTLEEIELAIW